MADQSKWLGPDSPIGEQVRRQSQAALAAYAVNPLLVREHVSIERETTQGGYGRRQIFELVQNGADALHGRSGGRVAIILTNQALYCANQGRPIDSDGVDAILSSHLNVKKANEIGRFGVGFKSVLAVSKAPAFFSKSGSFRFDHVAAHARVSAATGLELSVDQVPVLRTAEPIVPEVEAEDDRILRDLMEWASTVVKLPKVHGRAEWLSQDLARFPPEFLLFSAHVGRLSLLNFISGKEREITMERTDQGLHLRADDRDELWWTAATKYVPSEFVKEDGGVHAERSTLPLVWAVQVQGRIGRGRFWAFFPTETTTTLSGILNGPWKTNQDRQNLLPGPFNEEFIEEAARLVVDNLAGLVVSTDPGRHLDLLPSRDSYNWADELLGQKVFELCAQKAIVPDQDGIPKLGRNLRLHPEGLPQKALTMWAGHPGRPKDWVHPSIETFNRRPRVERIVPSENLAGYSDWLEALAASGRSAGSIAAVLVAAAVTVESKAAIGREVRKARIVLTDRGLLESPESILIAVPGRERGARVSYVAPALLHDPDVVAALRILGVRESDPATDLAAFLGAGVETPDAWQTFWQLAERVPSHQIGGVVRGCGWDPRNLRVRSIGGTWEPARLTLLPGRVVPGDGSRDERVAVDVSFHVGVVDHLGALGLSDGPTHSGGLPDEAWLVEYKDYARKTYLETLERRGGSRPRPELISVEELRAPLRLVGPLEVLDVLSEEGRAALTQIVLSEGAGPDKVMVSHESNPERYKRAQMRGPVVWRLRRAGRLATSNGIVPITKAVGPQLGGLRGFLSVAQCSETQAAILRLPATPSDVPRELWAEARERAGGSTDVEGLGQFLIGLVDAEFRPEQVRAQVGDAFETLPVADITVLDDPSRVTDLVAHRVPFLVVRSSAEADRLVGLLGMKRWTEAIRFEIVAVFVREPGPIVDEFPSLRWYIGDAWLGLELARCSELSERVITDMGMTEHEKAYILSPATVYWDQAGADEDLLHRLTRDLDLPISEEDCRNIASRRADHDRAQKLESLRAIVDPFERLAAAIGPTRMRSRLPSSILEVLEADRGELGASELGRVAVSLMGTNVLREHRDELVDAGLEPPIQWAGSQSARTFVRDLGFSAEYAGGDQVRLDALIDVDGPPDLPVLHLYQEEIASAIRTLLLQRGGRGLLSLPTGAGKTRIAVQALIEALVAGSLASPILWLAETEELCEQAVQAWAYVWRGRGNRERLRISRLWSANEAEPVGLGPQVVVATVAKLQNCVEDPSYTWLTSPGCVVVDEAHGAIAPVYTKILAWLGLSHDSAPRPLIGLTATPYRGTSEEQTTRLVNRFYGNRLDDGVLGEDQYEALQEMGVLAAVDHELLDGVEIELTPNELERLQQTRLMPTSAGARLALNKARNEAILASIRRRPPEDTVLLFAASVEHAELLAATLSLEGIPAAAISSRTPTSARRHFVEEFRDGRIRVLTNYAVLTEGFDAPAVRAVYVARPTYSPNLYQQMIGRGLRGPLNGGKERCLIVNVRDNIAQYGESLAFNQFEYLWKSRDTSS